MTLTRGHPREFVEWHGSQYSLTRFSRKPALRPAAELKRYDYA
jgi:hypothetical protein